jgi:hypothetical protein
LEHVLAAMFTPPLPLPPVMIMSHLRCIYASTAFAVMLVVSSWSRWPSSPYLYYTIAT